jgi:hypothetical protein
MPGNTGEASTKVNEADPLSSKPGKSVSLMEEGNTIQHLYDTTVYKLFRRHGKGGGPNVIKVTRVIAANFPGNVSDVFGGSNCYVGDITEGAPEGLIRQCLDLSPVRSVEHKFDILSWIREQSLRVKACPLYEDVFAPEDMESEVELLTFLENGCLALFDGVVARKKKVAEGYEGSKLEYLYRTLLCDETMAQDPHTSFKMSDVVKADKEGGGYYSAYLPLCKKGFYLQLWAAEGEGRLVFVPYGKCLFLRGDVVHGVGFCSDHTVMSACGHFFLFLNTPKAEHSSMAPNSVSDGYKHASAIREFLWPNSTH